MSEKLVFFEKADVNGANARQVYKYLKPQAPNDDGTTDIRWNFYKFLVDREGNVLKRYQPSDTPESMKPDIEQLLKKTAAESS
mmetsp:Transcript_16501/g.36135  ORF Transcript_16501/g.36135 Transcript_16501/m.36135 type:complete len:83 (-) Transcript_16501:404-652(-)